jgi:hypothetical protein
MNYNWHCLPSQDGPFVPPLTYCGRRAGKPWREFLPRMVAELETQGRLREMLLTAEDQTETELDQIRRQLMRPGLTAQPAHDSAWELVRKRYIFLPPEE